MKKCYQLEKHSKYIQKKNRLDLKEKDGFRKLIYNLKKLQNVIGIDEIRFFAV